MNLLKPFLLITLFTISLQGHVFGQMGLRDTSLASVEMELKVLGDSITKGSSDHTRQGALAAFNVLILDLLQKPETFEYPFDSLKTVSKLTSDDKTVRIYTWILPGRAKKEFQYFGIIQRKKAGTKEMKVIGLMEQKISNEEAESFELKSNTWYGAVYYDIAEKKIKGGKHYVLLGWQGNDSYTTRKIIDILYFDEWNNITFGAPVFNGEDGKLKYRVIFEFTAAATMLLRFENNDKMIVFDHLSPSSAGTKGQYRYYGPDFTYDGYRFRKGKWHYRSNLDLRN